MTYKAPKGISEHVAVAECDSGHAGGADRKHDVLLKHGYRFKWGSEFEEDWTRTGFFNSVAEFKAAEPVWTGT